MTDPVKMRPDDTGDETGTEGSAYRSAAFRLMARGYPWAVPLCCTDLGFVVVPALADKPHTRSFAGARPREEPDGKPD